MIVRDTAAMISGMKPELIGGDYVFCTTTDPSLASKSVSSVIGTFREREGHSFILPIEAAATLSYDCAAPMRLIILNVHSALDGVGLTAAVAGALAAQGIACSMVAAFHHDHVFVPADAAAKAIATLTTLSEAAASSGERG